MTQVVLDMEISSDVLVVVVSGALEWMDGVTVTPKPWTHDRRLTVTIMTQDPDLIDIVREIAWQFDPLAVQHAVHVADVS